MILCRERVSMKKNTAAKQKRGLFSPFFSFLIYHAIQSSLHVKNYDKEQTAFYNYFQGCLLFKTTAVVRIISASLTF